MQRLIPLIYFYVVSLVGLVLLIIGVFADVNVLVNLLSYSEYPLPYDTSQRCILPQSMPLMRVQSGTATGSGITKAVPTPGSQANSVATPQSNQPVMIAPPNSVFYYDCLKQVAFERKQAEVQDVEKALSFTLVGLIVFGIHFYFARKKSD